MEEKDLNQTNNAIDAGYIPERPDYVAEIEGFLKAPEIADEIIEKLNDYHENDLADALSHLSTQERKKLYSLLGTQKTSEVFSYLDDASDFLEELDNEEAADIIESMDADDAVDALGDLENDQRAEIIELLNEDARQDIRLIASFDEDEIGSEMTTNFIVIQRGISVKAAMKSLIEQASENDNISTLFVVEKDGTFYGAIDLKDLIIARENVDLDDITSVSFPYVYANEQIEDCISELMDYSEDSIPVLDNDKKILGVITSQNLVEVIDDEMGEDYVKFAALTAQEDMDESLIDSMKKRIPWLLVLLGLGLIVSSVVGAFEAVVSQLTLVVCFQSLILDMAGNVGTQSLAVTIRVLTNEELDGKHLIQLIFKEIRVGFSNGLVLGSLSFLFIGFYIMLFKAKTAMFAFAVSACIGAALMLAMLISSFTGTVIPIFFKKIKVDPAVASGPLITTINDLVAVVSYYGLTWLLIIQMLHLTE